MKPDPAEAEAAARACAERTWRARVATARTRVDIAQARYDTYDRMIRIGQPAYYDAAGRRVLISNRRLKALADEAQADLAAAKQALGELLEAARPGGRPARLAALARAGGSVDAQAGVGTADPLGQRPRRAGRTGQPPRRARLRPAFLGHPASGAAWHTRSTRWTFTSSGREAHRSRCGPTSLRAGRHGMW